MRFIKVDLDEGGLGDAGDGGDCGGGGWVILKWVGSNS